MTRYLLVLSTVLLTISAAMFLALAGWLIVMVVRGK